MTMDTSAPDTRVEHDGRRTPRAWLVVAGVEVALGTAAVIADLALPTLVLLLLAGLSLALRREGPASLGLRRAPLSLVPKMLAFAAAWSLFQLGVTMPVANHVSGTRQDLSAFAGLEGDLGMLVTLLVLSWTLAALGEELAYRGFLLTRMSQVLGSGRLAVAVAVVATSVLFGVAHSEQGAIGVLVVSLDGLAFAWLRLHHGTLWAPVLAHGFNNTLGFVTFFLVGPVHALW
ncbi:CPBP family intramembrane glutamic endopeptidase [Nocardioides euryhalodurans]|uniref:CPBP family intramembrane metalloprotease n=1 Tax=Nocardioides euryhalodurans TaxID=2518370 RepID=A0A4P7GKG1_9ACTN|nr:CPBP family intramembrane glutamic endopeptidase [Nocardioides euryhalodurans]QBR92257.1 CPBP family intramembrane metalloprotease [Nocardioides euryhalodurans]